jgi:cytochrome c oxidase subunit 2
LLRYYLFLGTAAGVVVMGFMFYWISKYHHTQVKAAPKFHEESGWGNWKSVVLTLLVTGSVLGFVEYQTFASTNLINPPTNADPPMTIGVTGQQFVWTFTYPNGYTSFKNLIVPVDQIIILNITSVDVDHSLNIASLSVAKDAIPGQYNFLWFNATNIGLFVNDIRCKELCGVGHANMIGNLSVLAQPAFNSWYAKVGGSSNTSTTSTGSVTGPTQTITIPSGAGSGANFTPASITVASGTTITFVDQDTPTHDVDFTNVPAGSTVAAGTSSPNLKDGSTYTITLTTPGTYTYVCDYHQWMKGTITVTG